MCKIVGFIVYKLFGSTTSNSYLSNYECLFYYFTILLYLHELYFEHEIDLLSIFEGEFLLRYAGLISSSILFKFFEVFDIALSNLFQQIIINIRDYYKNYKIMNVLKKLKSKQSKPVEAEQ